MNKNLIIGLLTAIIYMPIAAQPTNIGGTITSNRTLALSGSPYIVTSSLTINRGATLTIPSGVVIRFESGVGVNVYGKIDASDATFTSNAASPSNGSWGNLNFGDGINSENSTFTGCTIIWASNLYINNKYTVNFNGTSISRFSGSPITAFSGGTAMVSNSSIAQCNNFINSSNGRIECSAGTTINAVGGTSGAINNNGVLSLSNTTIQNCSYPVRLQSATSIFTASGNNNFSSNTFPVIILDYTSISSPTNVNLPTVNIPYYFQYSITVSEGAKLTIEENNIIKLNNSSSINVYGTLVASASVGKNIFFTSFRDDNWGGDSNGDAGATAPGRSNWSMIKFFNSSADAGCILKRVKIRYADKGVETEDASPTIDSSEFSINNYGLSMLNASNPKVSNNTFGAAAFTPIAMSFEADPEFSNNSFSFSDNQYDAIGLYGGSLTANARVKIRSVTNITNVTYVMLSDVTVPAGRTLTIDPGIVIKTPPNSQRVFVVNGTIIAEGTTSNYIVFTSVRDDNYGNPSDTNKDGSSSSPSIGDFGSFSFLQNSAGNSFKYCRVRYSNGHNIQSSEFNSAAFNFINANGIIQNCEIKDNANGINCYLASNPTIQDNQFVNMDFAVTISAAANPTLIGNTLTNVKFRALGLVGVGLSFSTELNVSGTVRKKNFAGFDNISYVLRNELRIANGTNINIESGVVIKSSGYGITCNGGFKTDGTKANPVIFTSVKDDNQGNPSDTNGDGNGSTPNAGEGVGIFFGPTSDDAYCKLFNLNLYYGGTPAGISGFSGKGVIHIESASPVIDNILLSGLPGSNEGIAIFGNGAPVISNTGFSNGSFFPVSMSLLSNPSFTNISVVSMGYTAILINDANLNSDATLNQRNFAGLSNVAYFMNKTLTINSGSKLTINSGVVIKYLNNSANIDVNGALSINGTATSKVIFTSGSDDSAGGDSNNNGNGTTPSETSFWIKFNDQSVDAQNNISHLDMRFAGNTSSEASIQFFNCGGTLNNVSLSFGKFAFGIYGTANPVIQNINIQNFTYPVRMDMFSNPTFGTITSNNIQYMGILIPRTTYSQSATMPLRNFAGYTNITYILENEQTINSGTTIKIPAGAVFKINYNFYFKQEFFTVNGRLDIEGTTTSPVVFTDLEDDRYGNPSDTENNGNATKPSIISIVAIKFNDVSDDNSSINNAIFRYMTEPISCSSSSPKITNSTFDNCSIGILMSGTSAPRVESNLFKDLTTSPIVTTILSYPSSSINNTISGTTWKCIEIINETLSQDVTLPKRNFGGYNNIPYFFKSFTIGTTATLTIEPGVTTKWDGSLIVRKGLNAIGGLKAENNIVFTSYRDDFYGGDMNSDSTATTPRNTDWSGIRFEDVSIDPLCKMKNCIIRFASTGINMTNASPDIQNCTFTDCSSDHISATGSSNPTVNFCDFYIVPGNSSFFGLENTNRSFVINAENNWWGNNTGPTHSGNANGTGVRTTDAVDYIPFRTTGPNNPISGDVSQNGTVQAFDAALILQSLVNAVTLTPSQQNAADVSGNGSITALDASHILQYNVGILQFFNSESYNRPYINNNTILELSNQEGEQGAVIAVPVTFSKSKNLFGTFAKIKFDTAHLEFDKMEFKDFGMSHAWNSPAKGSILFCTAGAKPMNEDATIGVMYFRIKENAPDGLDIPLTIEEFSANDNDQTSSSVSAIISIKKRFAINANTDENIVHLYPVPAKNNLKILVNKSKIGEKFNYTITDMTGKKLMQRSITLSNIAGDRAELDLNIGGLPTGTYQLIFNTADKPISKKFIIAK